MKILVTGSAGHLGESLIRSLMLSGDEPRGIDIKPSPYTHFVGSISDREFVHEVMAGTEAILHTATLHKPHVATHSRQDFVDTNITGTLNLLEEAVLCGVKTFVYTSTTSTFGDAMKSKPGHPAVWVTEDLKAKPKNIYGVSKTAAEDLCDLFHRNTGLACIILKTSRFFPEPDDDKTRRDAFDDDNLKVNELLFRRVDIEDIVESHQLALRKAHEIGFDRFIISATTPFQKSDAKQLGVDAPSVLRRYVPNYEAVYNSRNWRMFPTIGRVYDNTYARQKLGWVPKYDFAQVIKRLSKGEDYKSQLARDVGMKGYHETEFEEGPYPTNSF